MPDLTPSNTPACEQALHAALRLQDRAESIRENGGVSSYFRAQFKADEAMQAWRKAYPEAAAARDAVEVAWNAAEAARRKANLPADLFNL